MPFQSEKQRRYMHANLPDIANRWEAKYGLGGIADLNDLPEYYIPKNHGGLIPSHEAGIYGLAEGGSIAGGHQIGTPIGNRTGFGNPFGYSDAPAASSSSSSGGGDAGHLSHNVPVSLGGTKPDPTPKDEPDGRSQALINISKQKKKPTYTGTEDLEEQLVVDKQNALNRLKFDPNLTKNERQNLEVGLGFRAPKKAFSFGSFIKNAALAIIPGLLPAKLATAWKVGSGVYNYQKGNYDKYLPTDFKSTGKFATEITNTVKENTEKMKTHQKKMDVYKSLPEGHPERIALQAELEIGKKTTPDGPNGEGEVKHPPTETAIKFEDIETYNKKKMELASREQIQVQKDVDRSKQMAYWRMMMEPYMAAEGGRIPGGYNTGGLSNLFRLKNV